MKVSIPSPADCFTSSAILSVTVFSMPTRSEDGRERRRRGVEARLVSAVPRRPRADGVTPSRHRRRFSPARRPTQRSLRRRRATAPTKMVRARGLRRSASRCPPRLRPLSRCTSRVDPGRGQRDPHRRRLEPRRAAMLLAAAAQRSARSGAPGAHRQSRSRITVPLLECRPGLEQLGQRRAIRLPARFDDRRCCEDHDDTDTFFMGAPRQSARPPALPADPPDPHVISLPCLPYPSSQPFRARCRL